MYLFTLWGLDKVIKKYRRLVDRNVCGAKQVHSHMGGAGLKYSLTLCSNLWAEGQETSIEILKLLSEILHCCVQRGI